MENMIFDVNRVIDKLSHAEFTAGEMMRELDHMQKEVDKLEAEKKTLQEAMKVLEKDLAAALEEKENYWRWYVDAENDRKALSKKLAAAEGETDVL